MSLRHTGRLHYEHIPGRDNGREWRVADEDDDVVTDFASEEEAAVFVRAHNDRLRPNPKWRY